MNRSAKIHVLAILQLLTTELHSQTNNIQIFRNKNLGMQSNLVVAVHSALVTVLHTRISSPWPLANTTAMPLSYFILAAVKNPIFERGLLILYIAFATQLDSSTALETGPSAGHRRVYSATLAPMNKNLAD